MNRPIIAVDIDEVCADLLDEWVRRYNKKYKDELKVESITTWDIVNFVKPECGKDIYNLLKDPHFYDSVQPFSDALRAIEDLRELGRVVYVTTCAPGTMDQKFFWLQRHGFLPDTSSAINDYIPCKDKWLVNADILLDDGIHNVEPFPKAALLVQHTHNMTTQCSKPRIPGMGIRHAPAAVSKALESKKYIGEGM
jgi:5'-nucleotidase